jgi:hypothetical protein
LKLSQYLSDQGHSLKGNERLFLTNTLEPIEPQANFLLSRDQRRSGSSADYQRPRNPGDRWQSALLGSLKEQKGAWIAAKIDAYKQVDGKPLGEKNPKWLQDDYVKFIRFAQMKMDAVDEGIVGVITNHSWLDNPTFRGMRQSLMPSFEQVYVLDLHGNEKRKSVRRTAPTTRMFLTSNKA